MYLHTPDSIAAGGLRLSPWPALFGTDLSILSMFAVPKNQSLDFRQPCEKWPSLVVEASVPGDASAEDIPKDTWPDTRLGRLLLLARHPWVRGGRAHDGHCVIDPAAAHLEYMHVRQRHAGLQEGRRHADPLQRLLGAFRELRAGNGAGRRTLRAAAPCWKRTA